MLILLSWVIVSSHFVTINHSAASGTKDAVMVMTYVAITCCDIKFHDIATYCS